MKPEIALPSNIKAEIESSLEATLRLYKPITGGVSGDGIYHGELIADGSQTPIVLKYGEGVGTKEVAGHELLQPYLLTPPIIHSGQNHALFPYIEGATLHEAVTNQHPNFKTTLTEFAREHRNLWENTLRTDVHLDGYGKKIAHTIFLSQGFSLRDNLGRDIKLATVLNDPWLINGRLVSSLEEALLNMSETICNYRDGVISHGDEGYTNCIISPSGRRIMVDNGSAGLRAVYEPLAKILLWLEATTTESLGFDFNQEKGFMRLNTYTKIEPNIHDVILLVRDQLEPYLTTKEQKRTAAAYMMMYLLREGQWLKNRKREDILPHVFAKALALSAAVAGENFPFPLSRGVQERSKTFHRRGVGFWVEEDSKRHQVISINSQEQLSILWRELKPYIRRLKAAAFDLDGTILGNGIQFPLKGLQHLRTNILTFVTSGAGITSIHKKIKDAVPPESSESLSSLFAGLVIANEGAQLFQVDKPQNGDENILLEEKPVSSSALSSIVAMIPSYEKRIEFYRFYPTASACTENTQYNPSLTIVYVPASPRRTEVIDRLNIQYENNILVVDDLTTYQQILAETGTSKFVIKGELDAVEEIKIKLGDTVTAVMNEGYLNIVAAGTDKYEALDRSRKRLIELTDVADEQLAYFGNDWNDLEALKAAGVAFIINSSSETTKQLIDQLNTLGRHGYTVVVTPKLINDLLMTMAVVLERR